MYFIIYRMYVKKVIHSSFKKRYILRAGRKMADAGGSRRGISDRIRQNQSGKL